MLWALQPSCEAPALNAGQEKTMNHAKFLTLTALAVACAGFLTLSETAGACLIDMGPHGGSALAATDLSGDAMALARFGVLARFNHALCRR